MTYIVALANASKKWYTDEEWLVKKRAEIHQAKPTNTVLRDDRVLRKKINMGPFTSHPNYTLIQAHKPYLYYLCTKQNVPNNFFICVSY